MSKYVSEGVTPLPWHWAIEDASMVTLNGPRALEHHVLSHGPCASCLTGLDPKDSPMGRCTVITESDARYLTTAANLYPRLCEALEELVQTEGAYRYACGVYGGNSEAAVHADTRLTKSIDAAHALLREAKEAAQ